MRFLYPTKVNIMATNRIVRLLLTGLFTLSLLAFWGRSTVRAQGNTLDDTDQAGLATLSPTLADQLAHASEPVSFLIILDEQIEPDAILADLARAGQRRIGREGKADAIYRTLSAHATRTQAPLRAWLDAQSVDYRPFYIVNMIEVYGDAELVHALRRRPEVNRLAANPEVSVELEIEDQPIWLRTWTGSQPQATAALPWGLTYTNADDLWALGHTGEGIVISSQDTGVLWDHNALKATYRGWFTGTQTVDHVYNWFDAWGSLGRPARCSTDAQVPCDDLSHGSHTVGTMMGDGTSDGYTRLGMAPDAKWIGCRNMLTGMGTPASIVACFQFSLAPYPQDGDPFVDGRPDLGAHIVSNSWACAVVDGCDLATMRTPLEVARAAGQFVVASAGNDGAGCSSLKHTIALFDDVFTIGAHNVGGYIAAFSSRGPVTIDGSGRLKPDISAPGVSVFSVSGQLPDRYTNGSGTSMATPHIAGAVALLWSALPALVGEIDLTEQALLKTTSPAPVSDCSGGTTAISPNVVYGYGRLDVFAAWQLAVASGSVEVTLLDIFDQPMTNQTVTLTDMETGYRFEVQTGADGVALLPMVFAGDYLLRVATAGAHFSDTALTLATSEEVQMTFHATADYVMRKELLTAEPARLGSQIDFAIQITNTGTVTLTTVPLTDTFASDYLGYTTSAPAADSVTIDGAGIGHLRWDDLTVSFNRDLAPGASFDLVVTFNALQDTSALTPAGNTEAVASVADVWAPRGGGGVDVPITNAKNVSATVTILAPTAIVISTHDMRVVEESVVITWTTIDEQHLLGFHLHRRADNGAWTALTAQPIFVAAPNPAEGSAYSYADAIDADALAATRYGYALEILNVDGTTTWLELGDVRAGMEIYLPLIQR